jgi:hypothetical protein
MAGLQWCKVCDGPRFKWHVRDIEDVPANCWDCGQEEVEVRLVADSFVELRRALGQWALGDSRRRGDRGWLNRRRAHVRHRFDQVIGWWAKQPSRPPEFKKLWKDYRNRGRLEADDSADAATAHRDHEPARQRLDADRLHELTEHLKSQAEEERASRERKEPKEAARAPGAWRMLHRPPQHQVATSIVPNSQPEDRIVMCVLSGGDKDPREIEVPLVACADVIRLERDHWFARQDNGDVAIIRGGQRRAANWMTYFTDVYHKVDKVNANRVAYKFERTVQVNRCEATTTKGQRCRNDALEQSSFCATHVLRTS